MAEFCERASRIQASFPITFISDGVETTGICLDISKSGLLGAFSQPLDLWIEGELSLDFGQGCIGIRVRVARVMDREAGLTFLFRNDADRYVIDTVVGFAQDEMKAQGRSLAAPF